MLIRVKGKEYNAFKLRDQYTIIYFDNKNKRYTCSTWNVEVFSQNLQSWLPFEKAYGELIHCHKDSYELYESETQVDGSTT